MASFDASKAAEAAKLVGGSDSVVYVVDGVPVDKSAAHKIMADEIEYTEIVKKDAKLAGTPTSIHIETKRGVEEKKLVEMKARAVKERPTGVKSGQLKEVAAPGKVHELGEYEVVAAQQLYGEQGKAGVIKITTKR